MPSARLLPLVCLIGCGSTAAADYRDMALAPICAGIAKSRPADPEHIFHPRLVAKPRGGPIPADLTMELHQPDGRTSPVVLDADHTFDPRCEVAGMPESTIRINYPKSRLDFDMTFPARVPPGTSMSYATLAESVPVMMEAIRLQAGLLRIFAPKVRGLKLIFPGPGQTATIDGPDGRKTYAADPRGVAVVPWKPEWEKARVTLSTPLKGLTPDLR
ncbi:hypothetical protein FHW69_000053 [Luteibacter sp. Sphag1AF]|uniref:hypothetical protein n=1 Tax=Luteibacter sp. Sphag1AF TaxID=2587031 RepID=UPI00160B59FD|nr:hypothetical protein [Luteibacter sp. Sphag1AF]MBB3225463.1 hypothetical protein [Luteibacter sp. Sphag1AF]